MVEKGNNMERKTINKFKTFEEYLNELRKDGSSMASEAGAKGDRVGTLNKVLRSIPENDPKYRRLLKELIDASAQARNKTKAEWDEVLQGIEEIPGTPAYVKAFRKQIQQYQDQKTTQASEAGTEPTDA